MEKVITQNSIEFLRDNKIYFHWDSNQGGIAIGDKIIFNESAEIEPFCGFYGGGKSLCTIGSFSYSNSVLDPRLIIGRYCSIAWSLQFQGPRHPYEFISTSNFTYDLDSTTISRFIENEGVIYKNFPSPPKRKGFPIIENDVWIGQNVLLNDGIHIENGAIVASNSVVTKDVRPYEIVGGNPAKVIRKRFSEDIISGLLESEWWKYKFTDFNDLPINSPEDFIKYFLDIKKDLLPYAPNKICLINMP